MKPLRRYSKHYRDIAVYPIGFGQWLASIGDTIGSFEVTPAGGIGVSESNAGTNIEIVTSGGQPGKSYRIGIEVTGANTGLRKYTEILVKVFGRAIAQVETEPVTLINSSTPAVGTAVPRQGSEWPYECLLEASAAGATATFQIRVGNTPAAATNFGPQLSVTVDPAPDPDGKYRGTVVDEGNQPWAYHAADIVTISGTNAVASVTGVGI